LAVIDLSTVTVREADLGPRHEIGAGGTAKVQAIPSYLVHESPGGSWVYKKYKAKYRPVSLYGMQSLVRQRAAFGEDQRKIFDRSLNWPVRVVVDDHDGAAGVILPLLAEELFISLHLSSGAVKRKPAEGQFLFMDRAYCVRTRIPYLEDEQRKQICRSLCYAMALLDRAGVVYGDLSSRNFLFRLVPRPSVVLVDCDAVRLTGSAAGFGLQPHSPDWEPPEAIRSRRRKDSAGYSIQNKSTDRYKLGLAILRILTPGDGCSTNTDPDVARSRLPMPLFTLLQRALSDDPTERPPAKTWYQEMTS
jgi:DNA-binding helix-hairpin-helix protein with protein kinase domain